MGRYLMFLSYIGTPYRGLQVQNVHGVPRPGVKTVCGVLEKYLQQLNVSNEVKLVTSSRTDADVHALNNTLHMDLIHRKHPKKEYDPDLVKVVLNQKLRKDNELIRIHKILRVADDFHCRHKVVARRYLYRLAVIRPEADGDWWGLPHSVLEADRCHFIRGPFELPLFLEAAETFCGTHNFGAFTTLNAMRKEPNKSPVRTLTVGVRRGQSPMSGLQPWLGSSYHFWEIHFQAGGFLYRQVRRMLGAMVKVAQGRLTVEELRSLLALPVEAFMPWLKVKDTQVPELRDGTAALDSETLHPSWHHTTDLLQTSDSQQSGDSTLASSSGTVCQRLQEADGEGDDAKVSSADCEAEATSDSRVVPSDTEGEEGEDNELQAEVDPRIDPGTLLPEREAKNMIRIQGVPGCGLYLQDVLYRPEDLVYAAQTTPELEVPRPREQREATPESLTDQECRALLASMRRQST